jgi:AcrR family transcriptional regulator
MPPNVPETSGGGGAKRRREAATPRKELVRIRAEQAGKESEPRERILSATLLGAGELGYRKLTVQEVIERYGGYRLQFYSHFANLGECYLAAYTTHSDRLIARLLEAGASAASWREGLRAALDELGRFASEEPMMARGLMSEVHLAGQPALDHREEVLERLSRAVDSARREIGSRHSPPPLTAPFMVSAIESTVVRALSKGRPGSFVEAVPELERMVAVAYFGRGLRPSS